MSYEAIISMILKTSVGHIEVVDEQLRAPVLDPNGSGQYAIW